MNSSAKNTRLIKFLILKTNKGSQRRQRSLPEVVTVGQIFASH